MCAQLSTLNFGIFFVYWIDYAFLSHVQSYAWRVPVILQYIFLIPMLFIIFLLPETPRWLASHRRPDEALVVLRRLRNCKASEAAIQEQHQNILKTVCRLGEVYESRIMERTFQERRYSEPEEAAHCLRYPDFSATRRHQCHHL